MMICISCPRGCELSVCKKDGEWLVSGNACKKGEEYAIAETTAPKRVLTCLMFPEGSKRPVSVRTDGMVPKDMLLECAEEVYRHHPKGSIHAGDVLIEDILDTGCNIIATRDMC